MSGAGQENRWRRPGQGNRQNQDRTNSPAMNASTTGSAKDAGRQQAMSALSGNAWAGGNKGKQSQAELGHVPVRDFNANEVRDFLKKKYIESTADQPAVYHKVQGDSVAKRSSGAWGSRGNMSHLMPSGQDFFTQLKKQLVTIDQAKSAAQ
ncbi:hypothetical protein P153DRAFT_364552 [Dothidotthia symphoricarpi CBS 119687]|uniref:Uncharacterized protein n=1 Tax=Dothidotthia symphoricarpi CBS 119687 TaxID=1392245 RepID=A0A6A6AJY8_9PLEO|nr:uncharacterized protein P153DRAFT_364552 [Dothidotthia symphoricarpi CBS 119687]KAF2132120.1 hypothetical protein P153DRAFT_364552 [Dothidotthia symphoricarpi CBS 119687]